MNKYTMRYRQMMNDRPERAGEICNASAQTAADAKPEVTPMDAINGKGEERRPTHSRARRRLWAALAAVLVAAAAGGGVLLARYRTQNIEKAEMISANFHISSNYLKEDGPSYTVVDWGGGFDIYLFNYEQENIANIAADDITYTVSVSNNGTPGNNCTVYNGNTALTGGSFTLSGGSAAQHRLHISPIVDTNGAATKPITVTVTTSSPFVKTLSATFNIESKTQPDYTVADNGDGTVSLVIRTNEYSGTVRVKWNNTYFSPDNTNTLESGWTDAQASAGYTFNAARDTAYELLFFKNTTDPLGTSIGAELTGSGSTVTLGTDS